MKNLIWLFAILSVLLFSVISKAQVSGSGLYCVEKSKLVHVLSGEWDQCNLKILTGDVCFVGARRAVIDLINSDQMKQKFEGTDGEFPTGAKFHGLNISYQVVDLANDLAATYIIERCP